MSEWKEYKLDDIATYVNRGVSPTYVEDNGLPIINQKCIRNGIIDFNNLKFTSKLKSYNTEKKLTKNDILINSTGVGTAGRVTQFLSDETYYADTHVSIIRIDTNIANSKFIFYNLFGREAEIENIAEGSTGQIELSREGIKNIDILLPAIQIQGAIAAILHSLDNKIALLCKQNKTMEEIACVLFKQWFVEEEADDWKETIFSNHTEVFRGLSYKGSGLAEIGNGIPMHNLNSVYEGGGYKYEGIKYYNGKYRDRHIIKPGELIVTNTEQGHDHKLIGCPGIVPRFFGDFGLFSQHIYKLSVKRETYLTPQFFYYLLLSPKVREQVTGATNGSTVNMLAIDGLQITKFKLPHEEKVVQFSQLVKDFWQKKEKNYEQVQTLIQLRENLLPKLMSGEIKVKM